MPENSFFATSLRKTTVELHTAANQYDTQLEGKKTLESAKPARRKLFELLKKTSLGELNPIQALELFLIALAEQNGILAEIESKYVPLNAATSPSCMRKIIHAYVFEATAELLNEERTQLKRSYIADLLFVAKDKRKIIMECDEAELAAHCEPHFHELQQEIITNRI